MAISTVESTQVVIPSSLREIMNRSVSENTRISYESDIKSYKESGGKLPATKDMILSYLDLNFNRVKPDTLARRLFAIKHWHLDNRYLDPTNDLDIIKAMAALRRIKATPPRKANPLLIEHIEQIANMMKGENNLRACRNLAIITVGVALAFRCSELVNLKFEDITFHEKGVEIFIPYSKTDQNNKGETRGIVYSSNGTCPVKCLKRWLKEANITEGYVFRSINKHGHMTEDKMVPNSIKVIIKEMAHYYGLSNPDGFSGHSMRRGFVTIGIRKKIPLPTLAHHGRWKDIQTMMGYYSENSTFDNNPTSIIFDNSYPDKDIDDS